MNGVTTNNVKTNDVTTMHKPRKQAFQRSALAAAALCWGLAALAETIQVTENITGRVEWRRDNEYVLNGFIYVLAGGELHIEAGTVIKGRPGTQNNASALIVTQGGKIFAEGTPTSPIIFTAEADDVTDPDDLPLFERGLWGGLVLLGRASINTSLDTAGNAASPKYDVFEGLPDSQINGQFVHRFGGADDEDSSGVLRYVSIRHAGTQFQPNKELNGLSLGGVGRGTVLEFIEVYAAADDGFEFFGGTVNTKYLVSAFVDDDQFDTDQGWRGRNQFWFGIHEPGKKDNGGELNGEPNGAAVNATPVAAYEVYNATWIGAGSGTTGNRGMTIREYAAPKFYNCIFTDFGGSAVRIDDKSALHLQSGLLDLRDNLFFGFAGPLAENATAEGLFTDTSRNNRNLDPQLRGISREANGGLDPRPAPGSPALTSPRTAPANGFYSPVAYHGAFDALNWAADWTFLAQKRILTARGGRNPLPLATQPPVEPPILTAVREGNELVLTWTGTAASYRVQKKARLTDTAWTDLATTSDNTYTVPIEGETGYFRVVQP